MPVQKRGCRQRIEPAYWPEPRRQNHKNPRDCRRFRQPDSHTPVRWNLHNSTEAQAALSEVPLDRGFVLADKAYDTNDIRTFIENSGGNYCIPPKSNAVNPWDCDWYLYKERHLVECFFQKLKMFRRIATHYEKLAKRFLAIVHLGCIMIWLA